MDDIPTEYRTNLLPNTTLALYLYDFRHSALWFNSLPPHITITCNYMCSVLVKYFVRVF
jgi:hypothetical protein